MGKETVMVSFLYGRHVCHDLLHGEDICEYLDFLQNNSHKNHDSRRGKPPKNAK